MKLNINFKQGLDGRDRAYITDDRGEIMPCVRKVNIDYEYGSASMVHITLVVNRKDVTLGNKVQIDPIIEQNWI